jgi:HlyD family secretion protein
MRNRVLFILAITGILAALYSAHLYSQQPPSQPPVFNPAPNPYSDGIYANGIIESFQTEGENINIYPEVAGPITRILVSEGEKVKKGTPLLQIDESVQRATAEQQKSQAEAALALLDELKAQPRPETLEVAAAQVGAAQAALKSARDTLAKQERSYALDPQSISLDVLDNARNAASVAEANLTVARKQYDLTKAGAWSYDIQNQQKQHDALAKSYEASTALLSKYTITAPVDGIVLSIEAAAGSYVSPQGAYGTYTEGFSPLIVMGTPQDSLEVRCYIDEILVHRLPQATNMAAKMFIQGTDISVPLTFERLQPYVSPKIELSNQREERVDVRVLPVIFRFEKPKDLNLFPGQLVDVYIGQKQDAPGTAKSL